MLGAVAFSYLFKDADHPLNQSLRIPQSGSEVIVGGSPETKTASHCSGLSKLRSVRQGVRARVLPRSYLMSSPSMYYSLGKVKR